MKPSLNVLDKKGFDKYSKRMFTDDGYETLLNYAKTLTKLYFEKKEYPFRIGIVLGIPKFDYASNFKSKDELEGRLKAYLQILGLKTLEVESNGSIKKIGWL